jgi:hypothetical protein
VGPGLDVAFPTQSNVSAPALVAGVAKALAEGQASRGVIAPATLTDDELLAFEVAQESREFRMACRGTRVRAPAA